MLPSCIDLTPTCVRAKGPLPDYVPSVLLQGLPEAMAVSIGEALALYNLKAIQVDAWLHVRFLIITVPAESKFGRRLCFSSMSSNTIRE